MAPDTVIFDLGGVLIDWDPRHLYRKLLPGEAEVERFLAEVCTPAWNARQDAGRPVAEAVAERTALYPDNAELIAAYYGRWIEMADRPIDGSVGILHDLDHRGVPLYMLTNSSAEMVPLAAAHHDFFNLFRDVLISGAEGLVKPDPAIFQRLLDRNGLAAERCLFIDDLPANIDAANRVGLHGVHFRSPEILRADLEKHGLL